VPNALDNQWIDVFRAGNYGDKGSWTTADLQDFIKNFNPDMHEPPACIGHPKHDKPAYGWVEKLRTVGDVLQAKFKQVDDSFADMVDKGRFKKRSISAYKTPAGWMLRHVGFLGAQPPHVKGLVDAKFDDKYETTEVVFGDSCMCDCAACEGGNCAGCTDAKCEDPGCTDCPNQKTETNMADQVDVKKIEDGVVTRVTAFFQEKFPAIFGGKQGDVHTAEMKDQVQAEVKAALAEATKKHDDLQKKFDDQRAESAKAGAKARVAVLKSKLVADGRFVKAFSEMGLEDALVFAAGLDADATVTFGEGDKKQTVPVFEVFEKFMESLPKIVPAGAVFNGKTVATIAKPAVKVETSGGIQLDDNSRVFHERVLAFADEQKLTYNAAYSELIRRGEGPSTQTAAGEV
jgi:hypothetical protein